MNLNFVKDAQGKWVAEFEASSDFNLHLERAVLSEVEVFQKTAGSEFARVGGFPSHVAYMKVVDYDFSGVVYPKAIKIVTDTQPGTAIVTFVA